MVKPEMASRRQQNLLLLYILIGIAVGTLLGGFMPETAVSIGIVGDIFLNLLMMLVIPLVMLSMIEGITSLGSIARLGSLGWRTVLYYMATTALSVTVGLIAVNIVQPGRGITPGEEHPQAGYVINPDNPRRVTLVGETWESLDYTRKYVVVLDDQNARGAIDTIADNWVEVRFWEDPTIENLHYVRAEDGTMLPFYRQEGEFVSVEPELDSMGTGLRIQLAVAGALRGKEESDLLSTLRDVIIGDEEGNQGMIPRNVFKAMAEMNILPLIFFSLVLGAALSVLGEKVRTTLEVISALNDAVMKLVHWVMLTAPIGIFGLVAARIGEAGGFEAFLPELAALGRYALTVIGSLAFHGLVTLPLILWAFTRRRPLQYGFGVGAALLNAFSTASSSATLPLTMQGVEENNDVSERTAGFVLPLGATINMDGTALYESVAAIFIAQVYGLDLGPGEQLIIFFTATLAAIGAAGIPEAGLVTLVIVLKAVGLPIEGVALILTIDWLLDRFRTTVNVWGDSVGAAVIDKYET